MAKWYTYILSPIGAVVGDMPSKEYLADRWINENLPRPDEYHATLATLTNDITSWSNRCGDYIHTRNPLYNRANSRSICQTKIEKLYQADLTELKNQEYYDAEQAKTPVPVNSKLLQVVALVIILMVVIVLIIKM